MGCECLGGGGGFLLFLFVASVLFFTLIILTTQGYRHREAIIASGDIERLLKDDGQPTDNIPHLFRSTGAAWAFRPYYTIKKSTGYQGWFTPLFAGVLRFIIFLLLLGMGVLLLLTKIYEW